MKVAESFKEIKEIKLPIEVVKNEYINAFTDKMMQLSNRLNEINDDAEFDDALDIKEDYLPAMREFIANIVGL